MARPRCTSPLILSLLTALALIAPGTALSNSLPDTQQLLARWLDALGGRVAVERVHCTWLWSRFRSSHSGGRSEEWNASEGRFRSIADFNQFRRTTGYDGARGFIQDENGKVHELTGAGLAAFRTEAYLAANAQFFPGRVRGLTESVGLESAGGAACFALEARAVAGRAVRVYLDVNSYLPLRVRRIQDADTLWTEYSQYRAVDGVQEAFRVRSWSQPGGDTTEFTIEALRHLAESPPAGFFAPPPDTLRDFVFAGGADSASFGIELWDGHIVLRARSHGDDSLAFLLDTGAEASNLDASLARGWRLLHELPLELKGTAGSQWGGLVQLDTLAFPGVILLGQRVAAVDLAGVRPGGRRIAGVLGYDFLSRFVVRLDLANQVATLYDPARAPQFHGTALPLELDGFVPRIEAQLGDSLRGVFRLDTGAYAPVVLFKRYWQAHDLLPRPESAPEVMTAGVGGTSRNREAEVPALAVGPFRLERPRALFHMEDAGATRSHDDAGLIGMEFWRRFELTLDYTRRRMILNENRAAADSQGPAAWHMGLERAGR